MAKQTIGFGGSCHWCTEAIFQSLIGVEKVDQGWISSKPPCDNYSEAVLVIFDPKKISLGTLIEIHLLTHSCTSEHFMRGKYRSAIYYLTAQQKTTAKKLVAKLQKEFPSPIITQSLPFKAFKRNEENYLGYYQKNPELPFCRTYITPKLQKLMTSHATQMKALAPES